MVTSFLNHPDARRRRHRAGGHRRGRVRLVDPDGLTDSRELTIGRAHCLRARGDERHAVREDVATLIGGSERVLGQDHPIGRVTGSDLDGARIGGRDVVELVVGGDRGREGSSDRGVVRHHYGQVVRGRDHPVVPCLRPLIVGAVVRVDGDRVLADDIGGQGIAVVDRTWAARRRLHLGPEVTEVVVVAGGEGARDDRALLVSRIRLRAESRLSHRDGGRLPIHPDLDRLGAGRVAEGVSGAVPDSILAGVRYPDRARIGPPIAVAGRRRALVQDAIVRAVRRLTRRRSPPGSRR